MRNLLAASAVMIAAIALSGCGSKAPLSEGGPGGPQPSANQPVVTGVSPASVVAGGPAFTLTVTGRNFAQGDSVEWGFIALDSTFVSSTQMTAKVPSSLLNETQLPTNASIVVQTPVPNPLSFGTTISITAPPAPGTAGYTLSTVNVQANDLAWDPVSKQIYLSVAGADPAYPNTITALNPATNQFGTSVSAGTGANHVAVSSDSSWLYAGIDKDGTIQRFTLPDVKPDLTIPLGTGQASLPNMALDIAPDPVASNTIAVSMGISVNGPGAVVIFDGATPRPVTVTSVAGYTEPLWSLCWNGNGSDLYGAFGLGSTDPMAVLSVNSTGVLLVQASTGGTTGTIHWSRLTEDVYGGYGQIYDPFTNALIGSLPINVLEGGIAEGDDTPLAIDDQLGMAWIAAHPIDSPANQVTIAAFDLRTNALLGSIAIPNVTGKPVKLIRWGSNGLAFLTQEWNGPQQGDGVYILSGAFVTTPSVQ